MWVLVKRTCQNGNLVPKNVIQGFEPSSCLGVVNHIIMQEAGHVYELCYFGDSLLLPPLFDGMHCGRSDVDGEGGSIWHESSQ